MGIFPNRDADIRLVGAVLAEHEEWAEMRREIGLDVRNRSRLGIIDGGDPATTTDIPEVTANHALSA